MDEHSILTSDYEFDPARRVWARADFAGISYSDGDDVEYCIAEIINNACDLTVLSAELGSHCKDWPTIYHLSGKRGNVLRPFEEQLRGKTVLEVGAGCGAITRYLGETGADVLALEGSPTRASIAAARCRDLNNVIVVAEAFHRFKPTSTFDVITLIGVLEYARKFFPGKGADPVEAMLATSRGLLKPGGILIIAIENQLGLKYFAGFPEDHVGKPMFGIEGHYSEDDVVTFGRRELSARVAKAGLPIQQWWYPFPDYKLPSLMVSEAGALPQRGIDLTSVVRSACIADPQYPLSVSFNQERAWRPVIHNGLLSHMANSFVLLASDINFPEQHDLPLAVHYATDRRPQFAKKVVFKRACDGTVVTHPIALYPSSEPSKDSMLKQRLADQPFIKGELWQDRLLQILTSPGWTVEQIQGWIKAWLDAFCDFAGVTDRDHLDEKKVSGKYIDAIPRNMLLDEQGAIKFIDQEWLFSQDLNVGYLAFRALLTSLSPIRIVAKPLQNENLRISRLVTLVMHHINIDVNESQLNKYFDFEAKLDQLAGNKKTYSSEELSLWFASLELHVFDTQTPVHEKLAQCDQQVALIGRALAQRDMQLNGMINSTSWRITQPLRVLKKWLDFT